MAGLYVSDRVERAILERQAADNSTDPLGIEVVDRDSRRLETRGSSTDKVRLEERSRR